MLTSCLSLLCVLVLVVGLIRLQLQRPTSLPLIERLINWSWKEELKDLGYNVSQEDAPGILPPKLFSRDLLNPIYWIMTKAERHKAEEFINTIKRFTGEIMKNGKYFSLNNTDLPVRQKIMQKMFLQWLRNYRLGMVNAPGVAASIVNSLPILHRGHQHWRPWLVV